MAVNRWGAPAPSGPPMAVEDKRAVKEAAARGELVYIDPRSMEPVGIVSQPPKPSTASTLRDQLQARAEELRKDIAALADKQAELALIERMLEVK